MLTRSTVLILVLIMGTVGCTASTDVVETSTDRLRLDVVFEPGDLVSGESATFGLQVTNTSDAPATIEFDTTQRGDVRLSTANGVEVYHWAGRRIFAHEHTEIPVAPGERVSFALQEAPLPVAPGDYEVLATVTGMPKLQVARSTVSVVATNAVGDALSDASSASSG
jgi:hypothetical protein